MKRMFGDVTKALAQMASPDLSSLLRMVETDLSLVHAAYYTDDECMSGLLTGLRGRLEAKRLRMLLPILSDW